MPRPALAVMRRSQQPVDDFRVGIGRIVRQKRIDFLRGRRQADEIESRSAKQRALVGRRRRMQAFLVQFREHKPINRSRRQGRLLNWLKRPIRPILLGNFIFGTRHNRKNRAARRRPGRTHLHPFRQHADLFIRELAFWGHAQVLVILMNRGNQPAFFGLARDDGRPRLTTRKQRFARIQPQPRFLLFGTVAADALIQQKRTNLLLKKFDLRRRQRRKCGRRGVRSIGGTPGKRGQKKPGEKKEKSARQHRSVSIHAPDINNIA